VNLLFDLTLRGATTAAVVALMDVALSKTISARGRRLWWSLVPLAFLVVIPLPVLPAESSAVLSHAHRIFSTEPFLPEFHSAATILEPGAGLIVLWLLGAVAYLLVVLMQTRAAFRRWSSLRLSTDTALLELLEDTKAQMGITAPIGLVISRELAAPAIMGWLRPRLLLPEWITTLAPVQLRAILLHELAHFRSLDVPLNWLFTLARAAHWFNPAIHLAAGGWALVREQAADEAAVQTLGGASPALVYSEALLAALRPDPGHAAPFGALAIGESIHHLKRRLLMLNHYPCRSTRPLGAILILVLLGGTALLRPVRADDGDAKQTAVAAMQTWLQEIDASQYDQSWKDAAPSFQKALESTQWVSALDSVRTPLGKCEGRQLASALEQTDVPSPSGVQHGDFVIAQFETSFENMKYAVETVTFEKTPDGSWKAAGYYIKPRQ
jgi:beta-lactamase regulating signal transducer with metallopeptidase domain